LSGWCKYCKTIFLKIVELKIKALQKTIFSVVSCFAKYETVQMSKFETNLKEIGIFVIAKVSLKLAKIIAKQKNLVTITESRILLKMHLTFVE